MKKILSLAITLMLVLSAASIPAMAANLPEGAYVNTENANGLSVYTLNEFKTAFASAKYTAFEDFEETPAAGANILETSKTDASEGKMALYPFNMAVSGVDNATFPLKIYDVNNQFKLSVLTSSEGTTAFSSGSKALFRNKAGDEKSSSIEFSVGDSDGKYNVLKVDGVAQTDYKITAFGFVFKSISIRPELKVSVTYESGETATAYESAGQIPTPNNTNRFVGFKASSGEYISKVTISLGRNASYVIDDLAFILDKEEEAVPVASVEISGAETVTEPQYNATATTQLTASALDAEGNILPAEIEWAVTGNGATIDQEGLLTLKRTNDTSLAGDITVTATADGVAATKTITVTAADAYFAATTDFNATEYTKAAFVADLAAAQNKAVMNFEDGAHSFDDRDNANLKIYSEITGTDTLFNVQLAAWSSADTKQTGRYNAKAVPGTVELQTQNVTGSSTAQGCYRFTLKKDLEGELKPTAVGMLLGRTDERTLNFTFRVYLNGASSAIEYKNINGIRGFFGYEAPNGRYIDYIEIETGLKTYLDDLSFIFNEIDAPAITLTRDAAGTKMIDRLVDAVDDVYINIEADAFEGKKVLLALYGGTELLDVAIANEGEAQAHAVIPEGNTLTGIKAFVWDFVRGIIPAQVPIEINK